MKRIVLTGGPHSGKTVITTALAAAMPNVIAVPESATQIYTAEATRYDLLNLERKRDRQRRIYHLQVRQEEQAALDHSDKILLFDRGTVDGSAYWPEGPDAYWLDLGTTHQAELARYDLVIVLETSAVIGVYGLESNACRFEDAAEAIAGAQKLAALWSAHPNLIAVPAFAQLADKIAAVRAILDRL